MKFCTAELLKHNIACDEVYTGDMWCYGYAFMCWSARKYNMQVFQDPEECEDSHKLCASWAKTGECKNNAKYMEGDESHLGMCRLSCNMCTVCSRTDVACKSANRMRAGYLPVVDL